MRDQSFNYESLSRQIRKSDFFAHPTLKDPLQYKLNLTNAITASATLFNGIDPLASFHYKKRTLYKPNNFHNELVARKLRAHISSVKGLTPPNRDFIVSNLSLLLREGTPMRIYRLDIKRFYESIDADYLEQQLSGIKQLSPISKDLTLSILESYRSKGGTGVPRGLAISASLSDLVLQNFDKKVRESKDVFFVARYVDDIIIVTNCLEDPALFLAFVQSALPKGLKLNQSKTSISELPDRVKPQSRQELECGPPTPQSIITPELCAFDFLGYRFSISDTNKTKDLPIFRSVKIGLSTQKFKRYKTRISRSFLQFRRDGNFENLENRLIFLTSNFSIHDYNTSKKKLAGIFFSYPRIVVETDSTLRMLDAFLKKAILSSQGRIFSATSSMLTRAQKNRLLKNSFYKGHAERTFRHFSKTQIALIQGCWKYE